MSQELQHGQGDDKPQGSDPSIACNCTRVHRTQERPVEAESHPRQSEPPLESVRRRSTGDAGKPVGDGLCSASQEPQSLLAVMGITGVGKSSFINIATGGDWVSESSLEPCQKPTPLSCPFCLRVFSVATSEIHKHDSLSTATVT